MESAELLGTIKGQVEVATLQVAPPVPLAAEHTVVGRVDVAPLVGPQHRVAGRIHQRMHGRRKQSRAVHGRGAVDSAKISLEGRHDPIG